MMKQKIYAKTTAYIMDDPLLSKVWCMGFLSGYGKSRQRNGDINYLDIVRMKKGRGKWSKSHWLASGARGINIKACAKQKLGDLK